MCLGSHTRRHTPLYRCVQCLHGVGNSSTTSTSVLEVTASCLSKLDETYSCRFQVVRFILFVLFSSFFQLTRTHTPLYRCVRCVVTACILCFSLQQFWLLVLLQYSTYNCPKGQFSGCINNPSSDVTIICSVTTAWNTSIEGCVSLWPRGDG